MNGFEFVNPVWLWLLALLPLYWFFLWLGRRGRSVGFSDVATAARLPRTLRLRLRRLPAVFMTAALALLVVAMARPRRGLTETKIRTEGVDIVISLDDSGSMEAADFSAGGKPVSRLDISKRVIENFIAGRDEDQIGLVVFGTYAFTQCPLTVDYGVLERLLERVRLGMLDGNRTAIGSALAVSLNRLRESKAKSRIVILLTDGNNNTGKISPETAAEMARTLGVKIYTIGVGSTTPVQYRKGFNIYTIEPLNDAPLKQIAETTGGKYFRATDSRALEEIFKSIDQLEKTPAEAVVYTQYRELFPPLSLLALGLILAGTLLEWTSFRRLP